MQTDLTEMETTVFIALYGQPPGESVCFTKMKQSPKVKIMASTSTMHVRWTRLQVILWKASNHQTLHESANIIHFGYAIQENDYFGLSSVIEIL